MFTYAKTLIGGSDRALSEVLPAAFIALALGSFLFAAMGFASPAEIHNAAHDARHAFGFPCH